MVTRNYSLFYWAYNHANIQVTNMITFNACLAISRMAVHVSVPHVVIGCFTYKCPRTLIQEQLSGIAITRATLICRYDMNMVHKKVIRILSCQILALIMSISYGFLVLPVVCSDFTDWFFMNSIMKASPSVQLMDRGLLQICYEIYALWWHSVPGMRWGQGPIY